MLVDHTFQNISTEHYTKLFRTILMILEEELAFTKLEPLIILQRKNGVKLFSADKCNNFACSELTEVICEVIESKVKQLCVATKFAAIYGDASESRKTSEEKELLFTKIVASGFQGVMPLTLLLKCQSLKEFGRGTADGTFKAMIDAVDFYVPKAVFTKKIICAVADGHVLNCIVYEHNLRNPFSIQYLC